MRVQLIPFDGNNPDHGKLLYQIGKESSSVFWDDRHRDPILFINEVSRRTCKENPRHFVVEYNGELSGYLGLIVDVYNIGYVEAAALKKARSFYPARESLLLFVHYCFEKLKLHKLKCQIPVFNRQAEAVARSIGFRREGISKYELKFNGRYCDLLEMGLFPSYIEDRVDMQRLKYALRRTKRDDRKKPEV